MFALTRNRNEFVRILNPNKGITIDGNQYPRTIFSLWTNEEREAIGIYEVVEDNTNKKDEYYYINTNQTFTFHKNIVTASYGNATAKPLDELKELEIKKIKAQASGLLSPTDWHVVKATEVADYSVPSDVATYRANVRAKSNEMETQINACSDVDALKTLFTWVYDEDTNTTSRPLASFPEVI